MSGKIHLVFGGELKNLESKKFKNHKEIDVVGVLPNYQTAYNAWKEAAQKTVDNAMIRYYIAKLYLLMDESESHNPTQEFPPQ